MQAEFGEFRYLFQRSFVESSNENSIESSRPVKRHSVWTKDAFSMNFRHEAKIRGGKCLFDH